MNFQKLPTNFKKTISVILLTVPVTLTGCGTAAGFRTNSSANSAGIQSVNISDTGDSNPGDSSTEPSAASSDLQQAIDAALPGIVCWGDSLTYGRQSDDTNYPDELKKLIDTRLIEPIREKTQASSPEDTRTSSSQNAFDTSSPAPLQEKPDSSLQSSQISSTETDEQDETVSSLPDAETANLQPPEVVNLGVDTETTLEIAGRDGGVPLVVAEDFTIPAGTEAVDFEYVSSERNSTTKLLRESDGGVSTVTIDGVEGDLIRWYDAEADHSRYRFRRLEPGTEVQVHAGDLVTTNLFNQYLNYIPIIMMGGNGDWTDDMDLEQQIQSMIDHSDSKDRYVVAARPLNGEADQAVMDQEDSDMEEYFGGHSISLRKWMIENGLDAAGITPTATDLQRIAQGQIPSSLLLDDLTHFTPEGYRVMAEMFYEKMDSLGYFDGLKALGGN